HARVPVGAKKIGLIAAQRRPHMTNGVIGDPQVSEQEWAKREGMVAFAGFPLLVGGQLIGVVALFARHTLTESVFEALASVADVIAVGIRRNQVEATLRDREERFRQVTETMREVFYLVTANFQRTLYVSPAYETVWGTSRTALEANPRAFLDSVHPDDRAILQRDIERAQRGEPATESEFRIRRPDGTLRWILSRAVSVRNELGEVYRIAGVALDVTQRKQALDALRLNEERLRTLFEAVNLVVLGLDGRGTVNYVNPFFLKLSGYSQDQVLGRDWIADFLPERVRPQMQAAFGQLLQRAAAHAHYTNPIVTRSGEERLISWHNTVVRDASGRPTGTLSIGEDVTEHAQLEEQFRQAQKMEAVGRLAGGVAHDFNNVLTAVFGYVDLLKEQFAAGSPQREDLDEIRKAADRAAGLTRQLLAFSRQQVLEPVVMNPNSLIEDLEKMLRRVIGEDVQLSLRLAPKAGNVRVDPGQLQQVLLNLVVNARDAMPTGGTISITTAGADLPDVYGTPPQEVKSGPYIKLEVTDSGMGMSPETRTRIFEPFFTTKEKGKGTGLGLSTVYGIVKQSEGYIWVDSAEGRGTTFSVFLPRVDAPPQAPPARPTLATLAGTETVLLVEDDNLLRPLARNILATLGYTVLVAGNAHDAEGLAAGHQGPIHLLLTDVVMPGVSGADLAKRMKLARPDIRVLFMSGYLDDAIAQHGVLTPGTPFLHKPFSPQDLAKKVREVLG
ncbi:MAG TPA: PAS domain S-box protein, partial [Gemmatimonadales bacterium]|nr:PAS domain S-box protein [Gemmatimonadales bacterium]